MGVTLGVARINIKFHYLTQLPHKKPSKGAPRTSYFFKNFTFPLQLHAKSLTQLSAQHQPGQGIMSFVRASFGPGGFTAPFYRKIDPFQFLKYIGNLMEKKSDI